MFRIVRSILAVCIVAMFLPGHDLAVAQTAPGVPAGVTPQQLQALLDRLDAAEARIGELEMAQKTSVRDAPVRTVVGAAIAPAGEVPAPPAEAAETRTVANPEPVDSMTHTMEIPGGPVLKIKGFFDFNYGAGSIANPLVFPISDDGCGTCGNPATPAHNAFQAGEFDLFISSRISEHLSFLAEVVLGPDNINVFGLDIERYQLTYRKNAWFSASAGRFHTSLGYYNTAYHHGNWFSTAEGRPIMYLFEDSGGILPMHMVGLSFTGEVPHTEFLHLNWVAEVGNGNDSNPAIGPGGNAVQNFYSDRNYKATNVAAFIRPGVVQGLQIGGSWYHDGLNPSQAQSPLPIAEVKQNIESAYVVYLASQWEFMNEAVLLSNRIAGTSDPFRSRMAYTQVARRFGIYQPYFRYQYVNDALHDPLNFLQGKYYGPSIGTRFDFFTYAALKLQFNHLHQSGQLAGNGFNTQLAFTF
jgi:hypothetical protein